MFPRLLPHYNTTGSFVSLLLIPGEQRAVFFTAVNYHGLSAVLSCVLLCKEEKLRRPCLI